VAGKRSIDCSLLVYAAPSAQPSAAQCRVATACSVTRSLSFQPDSDSETAHDQSSAAPFDSESQPCPFPRPKRRGGHPAGALPASSESDGRRRRWRLEGTDARRISPGAGSKAARASSWPQGLPLTTSQDRAAPSGCCAGWCLSLYKHTNAHPRTPGHSGRRQTAPGAAPAGALAWCSQRRGQLAVVPGVRSAGGCAGCA
jgi:hypothetical protein